MPGALSKKRVSATSPDFYSSVTDYIIDRAVPRHSGKCIIAEAIKEAQPTADQVLVDLATIRFSLPERGLRYVYPTPQKCREVLLDFDQGVKPKPFRFRLHGALQIVERLTKVGKITDIWAKRRRGELLTDEENKILAKRRASQNKPKKVIGGGPQGHPITVIGGKTPPVMKVEGLGRVREFGVRRFRK